MPWEANRRKAYITVAVRRFVYHRAGGECESQQPGCLGDDQLEYHHVIGVAEWTGPPELLSREDNVALLCASCHNLETQAQAARGRSRWKLEPERNPGLR